MCCRYETQVGLVRNSWSDLFVLGLAQISTQVSIRSLELIILEVTTLHTGNILKTMFMNLNMYMNYY